MNRETIGHYLTMAGFWCLGLMFVDFFYLLLFAGVDWTTWRNYAGSSTPAAIVGTWILFILCLSAIVLIVVGSILVPSPEEREN